MKKYIILFFATLSQTIPFHAQTYKGSSNANNLNLRSILSIFTIGIFIFLGFASIEEIPIVNCEFYAKPINKQHAITIEIFDKGTGKPIQNQTIKFDITERQKEKKGNKCEVVLSGIGGSETLSSGTSGKMSLLVDRSYISSDDETHITFNFVNNSYYEASHSIIVHPSDGSFTKRYEFLKKEVYP